MSFDVTNPAKPTIVKDPDSVLDYTWDWSAWLDEIPDVIVDHDIIVSDDLTVDSSSATDTTVTAFIAGGGIGTQWATCRVTTQGGRTDDRTIFFRMRER